MSASDTTKLDLIDKAKAILTAAVWKGIAPFATAVEASDDAARQAQLNFGRYIGPKVAAMVKAGGNRNAAVSFFVQELNAKRAAAQKRSGKMFLYTTNHVSTWITAAEGYDSLTAKQQKAFNSLDVYRKLTGIPVKQDGQETRQQFVDKLIQNGITSEEGVRKAVTAERDRRAGRQDNPAKKLREDTGKVAAEAGKDTVKLANVLQNGRDAKLFLAGALWGAKLAVVRKKGLNFKCYEDGMKEALHPLTIQPDPAPKARKAAPKAQAPKAPAK